MQRRRRRPTDTFGAPRLHCAGGKGGREHTHVCTWVFLRCCHGDRLPMGAFHTSRGETLDIFLFTFWFVLQLGSPGQKVVERPNRFYLFLSFLTGDWLNWSKEEEEGERVARNSLRRRPKSPPDLCTSVNETSSNGCIDPPPSPPLLLRIQFFDEEWRDGFQGNVWGGRTYAPTFF